jgi:predicted DNA-binding protein with PD1-like motif
VARFEDNDDVLDSLIEIARKEDIRSAVFHLVGGMKAGKFVVGPETEDLPPKPVWRELAESHEILALGTIFWEGDEPKVHLHGAYGKRDAVKVGCMRQGSKTFLVLEAVIMELQGIKATRELDPKTGMALLQV